MFLQRTQLSRVVCLFPRDQSYCDGHLRQTRETDGNDARQHQQTERSPPPPFLGCDVGYILVQSFKMYFSVCVCRSFFFICQSRNEGSSASPLTRKLAGHHIRVVAATPPKQQQHPPTK